MARNGGDPVLSRRVRSLEVSPTVAMAQRAAALAAKGERILDFSVGEPDQPTPAHIRAAATAALETGRTRYTSSAGIPELRAAVAERYAADFGVSFAPQEVVITTGGKQALYLACQALLDRGDEVIVPAPCWPTFTEAARLAGGAPVLVSLREDKGFKLTARMIARAVGPRTKAVIVNSPSNPTGAVVPRSELLAIARLARRRGFTLLYDDTYARLDFTSSDGNGQGDGLQELRDIAGDRLVVLGTASKTYCMTGWRIGWVLGPRALVDACTAIISHSTQCPASFAQVGAVEALRGPQEGVRQLAAEYRRRRDLIHPTICGIPDVSCVRPEGGFYLFPNLKKYLGGAVPDTLELARRLLEEHRVAVVPGEGFCAPGHVRISFARSMPELEEGGRRIVSFLRSLRQP
jgi:aspartate aminotransferase